MKKKAKLFTTIASLCMAVALMAFGVYAATTQTLGVSSQVNFSVGDNIAFKISATVTDSMTTANTDTMAEQEVLSSKTELTLTAWTTTKEFVVTPDARNIVYTYSITNTGDNSIVVTLEDTGKALPGYFADETLTLAGTTTVAKGETKTFTVTYTSSGAAANQTAQTGDGDEITYTLKFAKA